MDNRKVVIISDDDNALGDLEKILGASGHDSVMVNDPLLAVDIVIQKKPDVILLELKMPRKSGFEIAAEINHVLETERVPIIVMSEFFKDEYGFLFNLCGINRHLKKPFNPLDVIWAIENVVEASN